MGTESITDVIKEARHRQGWSQADLAGHAGVSRPTVARLEAGQDASMRSLTAVLSALGLELNVQALDNQD